MKFKVSDVLFLKAEIKDYDIEGKKGKYAYCNILIEGNVFKFKTTVPIAEIYLSTIEERGDLEFELVQVLGRPVPYFTKFTSTE